MNGQRVIRLDESSYTEMCDSYGGYCTACGDEAYGVEPDARSYICESCGLAGKHNQSTAINVWQYRFTDLRYLNQ